MGEVVAPFVAWRGPGGEAKEGVEGGEAAAEHAGEVGAEEELGGVVEAVGGGEAGAGGYEEGGGG